MLRKYGFAAPELDGSDDQIRELLIRFEQWTNTAWDKRFATPMGGRHFDGEDDPDSPWLDWNRGDESASTTLFSLFRRGGYIPQNSSGTFNWRDYGDIQWGEGLSAAHYDWPRAACKAYLRTGNLDALRWGLASARAATSVNHIWESPKTPAIYGPRNLAGAACYEMGDHGSSYFEGRFTHTWMEGLYCFADLTGDDWFREAATDVVEASWRYWGGPDPVAWNSCYGEMRQLTWPLLNQVRGYRETRNEKYWTKAKELMNELLQEEQLSRGLGYIRNRCNEGNFNNAQTLMGAYQLPGIFAFHELATERNQGEWTDAHTGFLKRSGTWLTTPIPNGGYIPPSAEKPYGTYPFFFCPPGLQCAQPTSTSGDASYNIMIRDLLAWLAKHDPNGGNSTTVTPWRQLSLQSFKDSVMYGANPDPRMIGYLTNLYSSSESKVLGWTQLFGDRAANYWGAKQVAPPPPPPPPLPPPCSDCELFTGDISKSGAVNLEPGGQFFYATSGIHRGWLRGPADANFDLYFWRWSGTRWVSVASSQGSSSEEQVVYKGKTGFYAWGVSSKSGTGSYRFWLTRPGGTWSTGLLKRIRAKAKKIPKPRRSVKQAPAKKRK